MWRLYGNQGRGIELVFKYVDDPAKIYKCFLSKVYYENNSIFQKCYTNHNKFIAENNCKMSGLDDILVPLSLFYKDHIYSIEQEIRIIKKCQSNQNKIDSIGYDFKNGKKVSYYEMPYNLKTPGSFPNLELIKIIIGYKYSSEEKIEIQNIFNGINLLKGLNIEIEQTLLKQDYFGEN